MKSYWLCLVMIFMLGWPTLAQDDSRYFWEAAGLYVRVPEGWAAPVPLEQNGAPVLLLKPSLVGTDSADTVTIQFKLVSLSDEADMQALLQTEFETFALRLGATRTLVGTGETGLEGFGTSSDETRYGRGRALLRADGQVLLLIVLGAIPYASDVEHLNALYQDITHGTTESENDPDPRPWRIIWQRTTTGADGEAAFIAPRALALGELTLYVADAFNGLLIHDIDTTEFAWQMPQTITAMTDISGRDIYRADSEGCRCVYVSRQDVVAASGFAENSPASIAGTLDGRLYATDVNADGLAYVRVFAGGEEQEPLLFDMPLAEQPLLTSHDDKLYVFTSAAMLRQDGAGFTSVSPLEAIIVNVTSYSFEIQGEFFFFAVTTDNELVMIDLQGRITPVPLAQAIEWVIVDVAAYNDTLYTLTQSGESATVAAWRTDGVVYGQGLETLIAGRPVQAYMSAGDQHVWIIQAEAGALVDVNVLPIVSDDLFNMRLQLVDGGGTVLTEQIATAVTAPLSVTIPARGLYFVIVTGISGTEKGYRLGFSEARSNNPATAPNGLHSTLTSLLPVQRWLIPATAGQTLTARVTATSGTLDPSLRLVNPRGEEVEFNEDADPTLGLDAALSAIRLSNTGDYVLEVRATSGEGRYQLTVELSD